MTLHVLDGDATMPDLRAARLEGDVVVWREALLEGPWPRPLRGVDEAIDAMREAAKRGDEIVLWFDEDLFCRVNAAYVAANVVAERGARVTNATGSHAERRDLGALFAGRAPLDPALADAWRAYASPDPRALVPLAERLPWLRFHLERFPHARDGLSALERRILQELAPRPRALGDLHRSVAQGEFSPTSYGLPDAEVERALVELGPLVRGEGEGWTLTDDGAEVLGGGADRVERAGLDRWVGGVRVTRANDWRWDGRALHKH